MNKNVKLFEFNDLEIWQRGARFFARYDAGAHQVAMREDEISQSEAELAMQGKEAAIKMLFGLQRRLEDAGINPYVPKGGNLLCNCRGIRSQKIFSGWSDFDAFEAKLNNDVVWVGIPVETPYSNVGISEKWYKCLKCQKVWRLVEPDPPFAGLWDEVPSFP
ncbi:hypothetical protein HUX88_02805 [Duganella sp. BJB1802]|uniref:hypothetical protein n=1 Tax=Duganella sp. BJB1802 TaxID=2744575 RepID=UPI0015938078|nr:hypothetical protein [Duganella sp. BJB1802]NVD69488.1 hypothetical protein [Duganella sp. BJB1802]